MKALKENGFMKPFYENLLWAHKEMRKKTKLGFSLAQLSEMHGKGRVKAFIANAMSVFECIGLKIFGRSQMLVTTFELWAS